MARRKWLILVLACVVVAAGSFGYFRRRAADALREANAATAVRTTTVQRRTLSSTVDAAGDLRSTRQETLYNKVTGKVEEVLVKPGELVKQGQVLVRLNSKDAELAVVDATDKLQIARARLAEAEKDFANAPALAEAQLQKARQDLLNARVKMETLEAGAKPEELEQARANLRQAEINLRTMQKEEVAQRALYEMGAIARVEYEAARNRLIAAEDAVTNAHLKLESLIAGADQKEKDAAKAALVQAEINLRLSEEAQAKAAAREAVIQAETEVRQAEKVLRSAQEDLASLVLRSPFAAMVLGVNAVVGKELPAGSADKAVVSLAGIDRWEVEAWVDESDIARLEVGQRVEVTLTAMEEKVFVGRLAAIGGESKVSQGVVTYPIFITISAFDPFFRPGMTADAVVQVIYKPDVLALPDAAVVERRGRPMVELAASEPGGEPVYVRVEVGLKAGGYTEILSGVEEGQVVVLPSRQGTRNSQAGRSGPGASSMRFFMGR